MKMGKNKKMKQDTLNPVHEIIESPASDFAEDVIHNKLKKKVRKPFDLSSDKIEKNVGVDDIPNSNEIVKKRKKKDKLMSTKQDEIANEDENLSRELPNDSNLVNCNSISKKKNKSPKDSVDFVAISNTDEVSRVENSITNELVKKEKRKCNQPNDTETCSENLLSVNEKTENNFKKPKKKKSKKASFDGENIELNVKSELDTDGSKNPEINNVIPSSQETETSDCNTKTTSKKMEQKDNQFEEDSYDPKELDAYCDDVTEEDNEVYLDWVKQLEEKLSGGLPSGAKRKKKNKTPEISKPKKNKSN